MLGPLGRVVATILLFVPLWFGMFDNDFFLVVGAMWLFVIPTALRDIWHGQHTDAEHAPIVPWPGPAAVSERQSRTAASMFR
jgi:hypothetical protein